MITVQLTETELDVLIEYATVGYGEATHRGALDSRIEAGAQAIEALRMARPVLKVAVRGTARCRHGHVHASRRSAASCDRVRVRPGRGTK